MLKIVSGHTAKGVVGSRIGRLVLHTEEAHSRLRHALITSLPFGKLERYRSFLAVQERLVRKTWPLYEHSQLLTGLEASPLGLISQDMADLGVRKSFRLALSSMSACERDPLRALGWMFVAEGMSLYGPLLAREAAKLGLDERFGARHLAISPEMRLSRWRTYVRAVNALPLDAINERSLLSGADAGLCWLQALVDEARRGMAV